MVILRACVFAVLAISTNVWIHSCWFSSWLGSGGIWALL